MDSHGVSTSRRPRQADPFFMDAKYNDPNPNNRRRTIFSGRPGVPLPLAQDPVADWLKLGDACSAKFVAWDVSIAQATYRLHTNFYLL